MKFSIYTLANSLQRTFARFPVSLLFLGGLTLWLLLYTWDWISFVDSVDSENKALIHTTGAHFGIVIYYLSIGVILSALLAYWSEGTSRKSRVLLVNVVAHLALLLDAVLLWNLPLDRYDSELYIAHGAAITCLIIGGIFLPYLHEKNDIASWNFVKRMWLYGIVCTVVCQIVEAGTSGLLFAINLLFDLNLNSNWFTSLALINLIMLLGFLFLSRFPYGEERTNRELFTPKFLAGVCRFLFIPVVLGYLLVLYIYAAKILLTFELPQGGVCFCVTCLMVGCVGLAMLLYPTMRRRESEDDSQYRFEALIVRMLPVAALPMVALMTLAIGRRLYDYGITVSRLYMVLLNLWFYAVCIGLIVTRTRRVHWISLSFAVLFLAVSVIPDFNFCSFACRAVSSRVDNILSQHPDFELPMGPNRYRELQGVLAQAEAKQLNEDLEYLHSISNIVTHRYITEDVGLWNYRVEMDDSIKVDAFLCTWSINNTIDIDVPAGSTHLRPFQSWYTSNAPVDSCFTIDPGFDRLLVISPSQYPADSLKSCLIIPEKKGRGTFYLYRFNVSESYTSPDMYSINYAGYYFE